ncbi:hypothetical protein Efla_006071 [Eimeria flavescens]
MGSSISRGVNSANGVDNLERRIRDLESEELKSHESRGSIFPGEGELPSFPRPSTLMRLPFRSEWSGNERGSRDCSRAISEDGFLSAVSSVVLVPRPSTWIFMMQRLQLNNYVEGLKFRLSAAGAEVARLKHQLLEVLQELVAWRDSIREAARRREEMRRARELAQHELRRRDERERQLSLKLDKLRLLHEGETAV